MTTTILLDYDNFQYSITYIIILFLLKISYNIYVAMVNNKLKNIRKKLDKLDDKFLILVKKRVKLVNEVLKTKKFKNQIIDKKRIKKILSNIKRKSQKKNIDIKVTEDIWKSMINTFIKYEFRNFKK